MKALSLWQPWASLIALGVKTIETRSWSTAYRGPLLIHAAKRCEFGVVGEWTAGEVPNVHSLGLWRADNRLPKAPDHSLPLGAVVASCRLVDVIPMVHSGEEGAIRTLNVDPNGSLWIVEAQGDADHPDDREQSEVTDQRPYGDFTPGRFAWLLDDIAPTTERCPLCEGGGRVADTRPTARRSFGYPQEWRDCTLCDGAKVCDPIPARGRQGLFNLDLTATSS